MKNKKILTIFCSLLFAVGLSGCLSSGMPAPRSEYDSLVVVPVIIIDGKNTSFNGDLRFKVYMDNVETGETVTFFLSINNHGYFYLRNIPPGKYSITSFRTFGMNHEETYDLDFRQYLEVKEGALTIFPGKLTVYIFSAGSHKDETYVDYWIREIDEEQLQRMENYLKTEEMYGLWQ